MPVFKYALARRYISKLPETAPPKAASERRPTFSPREWKAIRDSMSDWVRDGKPLGKWRDRYVAQHAFVVLAYTGLRPGELRSLRWGDVWKVKAETGDYHAGHARGKTGLREFVFQPGSEVSIKLLYKMRCQELIKQNPNTNTSSPSPQDLVFCHPDGSPIGSYKHSFESLLKAAGVDQKKNGVNRTIYSLRHLYATARLSKEASPFLLARQMGTSVEMLEKHYGQTVTTTLAAQITKSNPANIDVESPFASPFGDYGKSSD